MATKTWSKTFSIKGNLPLLFLCICIVLTITLAIGPGLLKIMNEQTYTVTVQDKERISDQDKYLIYTLDEDGNSHVFEVTDSLFKWRWDSADTYNLIQVGNTYEFTTGGYRIPFLSMYPNIYTIELITESE